MRLVLTVLLIAFFGGLIIFKTVQRLREGDLITGIFTGKFREINKRDHPREFYTQLILRLLLALALAGTGVYFALKLMMP